MSLHSYHARLVLLGRSDASSSTGTSVVAAAAEFLRLAAAKHIAVVAVESEAPASKSEEAKKALSPDSEKWRARTRSYKKTPSPKVFYRCRHL